ncbi:MAG: CBS domain-containing protein [Gammaproteobacteria bacterium]|nr:CBS domain-containing protein [Gammaproteobacteria bacterium]
MAEKESANNQRSWLDRLSLAFLSEPQSRQELIDMLRLAQKRDLFDSNALTMMENVIQVADTQVRDIMVPRSQMIVIEESSDYENMLPMVTNSGHSRFPVIGDNRDEIIGILLAKDLLRYADMAEREEFELRDILRSPVFVPESKRIDDLLRDFRASRNHMALVVDEYSGIAGLVTIEDVLEQIVGEIDDEHDEADQLNIRRHGLARYSVRAMTPIEEFNDVFASDFSDEQFDTIAGVLIQKFGHVPERGEMISIGRLQFKIMSADSRRIQNIQVIILPVAVSDEQNAE